VKDRTSWDNHGEVGFYVGRALDHYRCYRVWIVKTKSERISDCLAWYPVTSQPNKSETSEPKYPLVPPGFAPMPAVVAPSLVPPTTGGKERVVAPTGGKERVSVTPEVIIQNPNQLIHQKRNRAEAYYVPLTEAEMHRLPRATVNKIGKDFVDVTDAPIIIEGHIVGICRDRVSKSICYKYYDTTKYPSAPRNRSNYLYIVIKWALANAKFSNPQSSLQAVANFISHEQTRLNNGPGAPAKRKHSRTKAHRNRPELQWYQRLGKGGKQNVANSATVVYDFPHSFSAVDLNEDGSILTFRSAMMGPDKDLWLAAHGEELTRLIEQGRGKFIRRSAVPKGKQVTYYNPQVKIKMKNGLPDRRVRGTIGGDKLDAFGPTRANTAALEMIRLFINSMVSERAQMMTLDIRNFYLGTPMEEPVYMFINIDTIPQSIIDKYKLRDIVENGKVVMEVSTTIYGLKEAGKLSQDRLVAHLSEYGYKQ